MHDMFYFTDVHGSYPLFRAAMDFCVKQDNECMIIYGGDACDRGPDGYRIMKELLANPRVVYLKGNHEDIFVHAAWFIMKDYKGPREKDRIHSYLYGCTVSDYRATQVQICVYNGGMDTLTDWIMDGMPEELVNRINRLPLTFQYGNMDFCHAGGNYKTFMRVASNEYEGDLVDKDDAELLLWDRVNLGNGWQPNRICVFGHTPSLNVPAKYYGMDKSIANIHPCAYVSMLDDRLNGRKIDMDTGAFASGKIYVLNCLTMKAYGFVDTDFKNEEIRKHDVAQFEVIQF